MMKEPKKRTDSVKKTDISIDQAMELSDEEWERVTRDEPRDFPKSYYLCKQNPDQYTDQDV